MPSNRIFGPVRSRIALADDPRSAMRIGRKTFEDIENFIADNQASAIKVQTGIDLLARGMILVIKGNAQAKAMGPIAPNRRSNPALAYRIPVQRITGRYFAGWTTKRLGHAHWLLTNNSVEAYLIETGLYQRVRRPILKMSTIKMLGMLQTSRTGERFMDWVLAPRRNARGQFQPFTSRVGGALLAANTEAMAGPQGELP